MLFNHDCNTLVNTFTDYLHNLILFVLVSHFYKSSSLPGKQELESLVYRKNEAHAKFK